MEQDTKLIHTGRYPEKFHGSVNPPIFQTSTIIFPTVKSYHDAENGKSCYSDESSVPFLDSSYGITGTPTTFALAEAIAKLEGGDHTLLVPSGLSAVTMTLMALLGPGDHLLMPESVYGPSRRFCIKELSRLGIITDFYDPTIGEGIAELMKQNTRIVFTESPGSLMFEVQDIPAIAKVAHARNAIVVTDNSWATPLHFKPFEHGVDISLQAITKFIGGHGDIIMGAITSKEQHFRPLYDYFRNSGLYVSPHDCYMAQRGVRTLSSRLKQHYANGMALADWLKSRKEVAEILYPALPGDRFHDLWKRDYTGACGLFTFVLHPEYSQESVYKMMDAMELFAIGVSWGGYESLILSFPPSAVRSGAKWKAAGPAVRIHAGLEDPGDLIRDLEAGFKFLTK